MDEAKKLHKRLLSGPTVDIYVGKERKRWTLHRNLLCHHSSYFEAEFEGHEVPRRDDGRKLELLDDDPKGFELLVKWLYQGQLEDSALFTEEAKYDYAVACHKLYMLCDKFDMIQLKNLAMDQYRSNLHAAELVPDAEEINEIYRAAPRGSPFRALMTQIAARQIMDPDVDKDAESYRACFENNPDFAVDMVNAIRYMSGGMLFDDPTDADFCSYHDHTDGSSCGGGGKQRAKPVIEADAAEGANDPKASVARKQIPAELSAERRTPRKLDVHEPKTPTPNQRLKRKTPASAPNVAASTTGTMSNGVHSQPSSASGGPPKLEIRTPAKPALGARTVLGKRRVTERRQIDRQSNGSMTSGPRKLGRDVNGIVQQLNGVDTRGTNPSQKHVVAGDLPIRNAASKQRDRPHVNGVK